MAMAEPVVWNGTDQEAGELRAAIARNCACVMAADGHRVTTCALHAAMLDQTAVDHLLYVRRRLATHAPGANNRVIHLEAS